jgi:hypothetical protein
LVISSNSEVEGGGSSKVFLEKEHTKTKKVGTFINSIRSFNVVVKW